MCIVIYVVTIFFVEFVDICGDRSSKEKSIIVPFTETSQEWTGNMTGRAKEETIDKDIRKIGANRSKYESD